MTSPNKPTSKPSRVAKMSVKPIWRKKPNLCNTSNVLNANSPTPMPKPLTPHHEPSQENNHPNQALPNPYIKDTTTSPQVVSHPPFPISPINSHVTHTQALPQSDNQTNKHTTSNLPNDIIFGFAKKSLCTEFEKMVHKKFQMSFMGELTFFLGSQVKQKEDGIFISQDKYVNEILNKLGFSDVKTARTPMETQKPLLQDADGEDVDEHLYRSMIGSLMYLTSSRPDIMFVVCQPKLGLWYPKDIPFDLVAYTDSDYARASLDRKSTTRGCQFQGCRLIS
ncbi:uncharacterized mitochondrial protein-like protein [Tanacetum coccineum]